MDFEELKKQVKIVRGKCTRSIRSKNPSLKEALSIKETMVKLHSMLLEPEFITNIKDVEREELNILNYESNLDEHIKKLQSSSEEWSRRYREVMNWEWSNEEEENAGINLDKTNVESVKEGDVNITEDLIDLNDAEEEITHKGVLGGDDKRKSYDRKTRVVSNSSKKEKSDSQIRREMQFSPMFIKKVKAPVRSSTPKRMFRLAKENDWLSSPFDFQQQRYKQLVEDKQAKWEKSFSPTAKENVAYPSQFYRHRATSTVSNPPTYGQYHIPTPEQLPDHHRQNQSKQQTVRLPTDVNVDMFPRFTGKASEWKVFRRIVEKLLIYNSFYEDIIKETILLKIVDAEPRRVIHLAMVNSDDISDIWQALCREYDSPVKVWEQINEMVKKLPEVKHRDDMENLKLIREAVDEISKTMGMVTKEDGHSVFNTINSIGNRFYLEAERHIIAKIHTLSDLQTYVNNLYKDAAEFDRYRVKKGMQDGSSKRDFSKHKAVNSAAIDGSGKCKLCEESHAGLASCVETLGVQVVADKLMKLKLCWKCLKNGHQSRDCQTFVKCQKCNRAHLSQIHEAIAAIISRPKDNNGQPNMAAIECQPSLSQSLTSSTNTTTSDSNVNASGEAATIAAIQVASISKDDNWMDRGSLKVMVEDQVFNETRPVLKAKIKDKSCKILLDFGSEVTLISKDLLKNNVVTTKPCYAEAMSPLAPDKVVIYTEIVGLVLSKAGYGKVEMDAIVAPNLKNSLIIVGTDMMNRLIEKHQLSVDSKFGNIDLVRKNKVTVAAVSIYEPSEQDQVILEEPEIAIKCLAFGKYQARLPFLSSIRPPNNFDAALVLAKKVKTRLIKNNMVDIYKSQLFEYIKHGHAEEVEDMSGFFLPHHPVLRDENESTPIRIVFNGSFGFHSLNDLLWKGTVVGLDLQQQLFQFRKGPFAVTMDISKAFLQILVHPDDRKFLKFLWIDNDNKIRIFQMTALPFGIISSPAILSSVVQHLLKSSNLTEIANRIYMDDILIAKYNEMDLVRLVAKTMTVFKAAGFQLHKIKTNSLEVGRELELEIVETSKILGMIWNVKNDELCLNIPILEEIPYNRKSLLSVIGRLFDPLGFIDPIKLVLRKIHRRQIKLDWDKKFEEEVIVEIRHHLQEYQLLKNLAIPRNLGVVDTIHGFADASKESYGYVIYGGNQEVVHYVCGKSKLGSLKYTIVELELIALYELSIALIAVTECFKNCKVVIWSDNRTNLHRLEDSPNKFHRKIAGTVLKLLKNIKYLDASTRHIAGKDNPADVFSRLVTIKKFMERVEFKLLLVEPRFVKYVEFKVYEVASVVLKATKQDVHPMMEDQQLSDDTKKEVLEKALSESSSIEDLLARLISCGIIQKDISRCSQFDQLYSHVQQYYQVGRDKMDRKLNFIKENGIWKIHTRDPNYKPIFLTNSQFAKLLVRDVHLKRFHGGIKDTVAAVRENFYIVNCSRLIRSVIHHCETCQKMKSKIVRLPDGNLPKARTTLLPFEALSCDLFGPHSFKNGSKFWGLVTTCLCSRFIKIEPVKNLSAEESVMALEKIFDFVGEPNEMFSDNGTNFIKAKTSFTNIRWHLSPPHAPWYNGTVERIIAIVKRCLSVIDHRFNSLEDVRKAFSKIESIINTRPLFMSEQKWISPFELIFSRPKIIHRVETQQVDSSIGKLREILLSTRKQFEKQWRSEYVRELSMKYRGKEVQVVVGQKVLVPELLKKRSDWPVAQITKVWPSADGLPRVVDLVIENKSITRPLNGLVVLPYQKDSSLE